MTRFAVPQSFASRGCKLVFNEVEAIVHLKPLGSVSPTDLGNARVTLHNAVQLIASAGHNLGEPKPDDSHRSMIWEPELLDFRGVQLKGDFFVRIRTVEFIAELVSPTGVFASIELEGAPLVESLSRLQEKMPASADDRSFGFAVFDESLPNQELISKPLKLPPLDERLELALYYAHAFETLRSIVKGEPEATPIRTWPHHFDMATILPGSGEGSSIGFGLSPGDGSYAEPYWYITPSPFNLEVKARELPEPWQWHTEGWNGIVLTASRLLSNPGYHPASPWLRDTILVCLKILRSDQIT